MPAASQVLEKEYNYADTLWCTYIVSVVAASIAELSKLHEIVSMSDDSK